MNTELSQILENNKSKTHVEKKLALNSADNSRWRERLFYIVSTHKSKDVDTRRITCSVVS